MKLLKSRKYIEFFFDEKIKSCVIYIMYNVHIIIVYLYSGHGENGFL